MKRGEDTDYEMLAQKPYHPKMRLRARARCVCLLNRNLLPPLLTLL
jgi:hypothetical protein